MSITIVNPLKIPKGRQAEAITVWDEFEKYFSQQDGYISAKLLESTEESACFQLVTLAEWSDEASFEKAMSHQELDRLASKLPSFERYPGSYRVIRHYSYQED